MLYFTVQKLELLIYNKLQIIFLDSTMIPAKALEVKMAPATLPLSVRLKVEPMVAAVHLDMESVAYVS